ncbi:uncharacterized protein LOC131849013 [Achroia grisella]|uniref:uncharacterized protein LOC131849013 n=1 Tax=Achroia grisella TaxID=688607 RepID=UPI0027D2BB11|nr:uncharacterized protein LOC131849013 [Achroia grisella]
MNISSLEKSILKDVSWIVKLKLLKEFTETQTDKIRRVGIASLILPRQSVYRMNIIDIYKRRTHVKPFSIPKKNTEINHILNNRKGIIAGEMSKDNTKLANPKTKNNIEYMKYYNENHAVSSENVDANQLLPNHKTRKEVSNTYSQRNIKSQEAIKSETLSEAARFKENRKALLIKRQQDSAETTTTLSETDTTEDTDMKMKLFRLMYETVKDSDLKTKRAELFQMYYQNSTGFQIGYLMGDLTDKFNVMTDISLTLSRYYDEWKPIEHINAYEQMSNDAIEINHMVDLIFHVHNTNATSE